MKFSKLFALGLALVLLAGCSSTDDTSVTTTSDSGESHSHPSPPVYTAPPEIDDPRDLYAVDDGQVIGSAAPDTEVHTHIVDGTTVTATVPSESDTYKVQYSGFTIHGFTTPVKSDDSPFAVITPIYSKAGLQSYISENSGTYDFGEGEGSIAHHVEHYDDSFFYYNGILVISMRDGADGFFGAWEEVEGEFSVLTLAIREAATGSDSTHIIVEMDSRFMALWDSYKLYTE